MQRWQEQWELHQAEVDWLLLALKYMKTMWNTIAMTYDKPGYAATAQQKHAMYSKMEAIVKVQLTDAGYGHLLLLPEDEPFWHHINREWQDIDKVIARIKGV